MNGKFSKAAIDFEDVYGRHVHAVISGNIDYFSAEEGGPFSCVRVTKIHSCVLDGLAVINPTGDLELAIHEAAERELS